MTEKNLKWKQRLLSSGYPLEYVTEKTLEKSKYKIFGEYPYLRESENGVVKEFSVDIRTWKSIIVNKDYHSLQLLIECKYLHDGTIWLFSPTTQENNFGTTLLFDNSAVKPFVFDQNQLRNASISIQKCRNGVQINHNDDGRDSIKKGLYQLKFATPLLFKEIIELAVSGLFGSMSNLTFFGSILVTTAEIRVLNQSLDLSSFKEAKDISELSEKKKFILVEESAGPQLHNHVTMQFDTLMSNHGDSVKLKINEYQKAYQSDQLPLAPSIHTLSRDFINCSEKVLVVNFDYLMELIEILEKNLSEDLKNINSDALS
ncbi:hypothetical protein [Marinicella sp. W31]|uniref:hypothetical protein n=1 Tax=Marinicella sp. W31 TaxID=3023713 RepID=UPI003756B074